MVFSSEMPILQQAAWAGTAISALVATLVYMHSVRRQIAQTLMELEDRFGPLRDAARRIDPESGLFRPELHMLITHSLKEPKGEKKPRRQSEHQYIADLDSLLRFLLLLSSMHKHRMLSRSAIAYQYHYWFRAVCDNRRVFLYACHNFPNLAGYLLAHRRSLTRPAFSVRRSVATLARQFRRTMRGGKQKTRLAAQQG
jgi:hypothetical protein